MYGDTVKVCNTHPDHDHDANVEDPPSARTGNGARSHTTSRDVNWHRIYWPEGCAEAHSRCTVGTEALPSSVYIRPKLAEI